MTTEQTLAAWARCSRFHTVGVVLDLGAADAPAMLRALKSSRALDAVRVARRARHPFVVLAGQLLRKRGPCFAATLADAAALPLAALAGADRLTAAGEAVSLWLVLCDDEPRGAVMDALAGAMATEGSA